MKIIIRITGFFVIFFSLINCTLFTTAGLSSQGQPIKKVISPLESTTANSVINLDHSQWDILLKKYVDEDGLVDYAGFKNDREALNSYMKMLSSEQPDINWSVQELLAYYINLYNAYTVDLILENYPVNSIKDISGPWTKGIVPIGKNNLSLGGVENGVLRKMNEPRIHFAINCASISCPILLNEAFTAAKINEQLNKAAQGFINSGKNDIKTNNPRLSSIFKWYQKDFIVDGEQNVIAYINQFSSTKISSDATIGYKEYNWNLNEQQ